jgi:hypothetical protein
MIAHTPNHFPGTKYLQPEIKEGGKMFYLFFSTLFFNKLPDMTKKSEDTKN